MNVESYQKSRAALIPLLFDFASLNTLARETQVHTRQRSAAKDANAELDGMEII